MKTMIVRKKKAGRPGKTVKKEVRAAVRFSRHEYFIVREKASRAGQTISFYIRQAAIESRIVPRITAEETALIRQLAGMAVNFNQVAKIAHREGLYESMQYFNQYRQALDEVIKKLHHDQ
jgi:hypothetical protein